MNLIEKELELAKETEMFGLIPGTKLVELSRRNVAKVEAIIQNDSSYIKSSDKKAGPNGKKYGGATAYWMEQFSQVLSAAEPSAGEYAHVLREVVNAVDRDNSTHLNADGVGREEMLDRLLKIPKQTLVQYLKFPKESNYRIIQWLSLATRPKSPKYKPRENLSFASKPFSFIRPELSKARSVATRESNATRPIPRIFFLGYDGSSFIYGHASRVFIKG